MVGDFEETRGKVGSLALLEETVIFYARFMTCLMVKKLKMKMMAREGWEWIGARRDQIYSIFELKFCILNWYKAQKDIEKAWSNPMGFSHKNFLSLHKSKIKRKRNESMTHKLFEFWQEYFNFFLYMIIFYSNKTQGTTYNPDISRMWAQPHG